MLRYISPSIRVITTEFIGYDRLTAESEISVLTTEDEIVEALTDGQTGTIITKETPFYGTMGGQEGDFGQITAPDGSVFEVKDTIHLQGGKIKRSCRCCSKGYVRGGRKSNHVG